jgi:hypothetical protein
MSWDQACGRGWGWGFTATLVEGFLSSISILSRAGYLFHTLPSVLLLLWGLNSTNKRQKYQNGLIVILWIAFLAVSVITVNHLRYSNQAVAHTEESIAPKVVVLERIAALIVDRWIGLEGVMTVVAYPEKSIDLLEAGFMERRLRGNLDLYTTEIARVDSNTINVDVSQYASLPGAIAFFYYSGSLPFVFIGVFILVLVMWGAERLILLVSRNPYLGAFWAMSTAQAVASFGVGNLQTLQYFCISGIFVLVLATIASLSSLPNRPSA